MGQPLIVTSDRFPKYFTSDRSHAICTCYFYFRPTIDKGGFQSRIKFENLPKKYFQSCFLYIYWNIFLPQN